MAEHGFDADRAAHQERVLLGHVEALEAWTPPRGARVRRLDVAGAFHTAAMQPAVEGFAALVRDLPGFSDYVMNAMAERMRRMNDNLRAAQTVEGVDARVTTNTSLSMEEDATLPPPPPKRAGG